MKKNPLSILTLLFFLQPFRIEVADAFEMHLLKNDKELVSHAYSRFELHRAERQASQWAEQAFDLMGASFQELEAEKNLCDASLFNRLTFKLNNARIPSHQRNIQHLLTLWRHHHRIDDLFFGIIEQAAETGVTLSMFEADPARNWEIEEMRKLIRETGFTKQDLFDFYSGFRNASVSTPGCTLNRWNDTRERILSLTNDVEAIRLMNIAALDSGILTAEGFTLVEAYRTNGFNEGRITLTKYLQILKEIKNRSLGPNPRGSAFEANELSSKIPNRKSGLTHRQALYYRFNGTQIRMIEEVLRKLFDRMDAKKTEVIFTYQNGSESIPVSPMGQYFLARKLLRKDIDDLNRSSFFTGNPVNHEDLVTAGLETGLLDHEILDSVLKIDDLWNPEVKKWQKISNYAFRVTGTATIFLPPPYNVVSSMALVFLDGIIMKNSRKASQSDKDYDVF